MVCSNCGYENNLDDALSCSRCGKSFREEKMEDKGETSFPKKEEKKENIKWFEDSVSFRDITLLLKKVRRKELHPVEVWALSCGFSIFIFAIVMGIVGLIHVVTGKGNETFSLASVLSIKIVLLLNVIFSIILIPFMKEKTVRNILITILTVCGAMLFIYMILYMEIF